MNQAQYNDRLHCCITWQILVLGLNRVPRKYNFKLGKYTKSNGARSVEYGWWIARLNPNTISSNVFLVVWHGAVSRCNITFSIWAAKSGCFFHKTCTRRGEPSRTKHTNSWMWRTSLIQVSHIQLNSTSVHKWHTQFQC